MPPVIMAQQQQSEKPNPVVGEYTDIVWLARQHGLLVRLARPSDSDGRFDLIFRDGELWAIIGTTRLLPTNPCLDSGGR
jgi:hypothetical protein